MVGADGSGKEVSMSDPARSFVVTVEGAELDAGSLDVPVSVSVVTTTLLVVSETV